MRPSLERGLVILVLFAEVFLSVNHQVFACNICSTQVTANNSISLAQFDYAVKFEEEYREAIASGMGSAIVKTTILTKNYNFKQKATMQNAKRQRADIE